MKKGLRTSAMRALLRRATKPIPIVGTGVVLLTAAGVLRRKGLLRGGLDLALDAVPIVGTAKGLVELVRGDLIPERERPAKEQPGVPAKNEQRAA